MHVYYTVHYDFVLSILFIQRELWKHLVTKESGTRLPNVMCSLYTSFIIRILVDAFIRIITIIKII